MKQFSYRHQKEAELMEHMDEAAKQNGSLSEEELFSFADFNQAEAEKTGYSNYSYWSSTMRAFLKNKVAVVSADPACGIAGIYLYTAHAAKPV